MKYLLFYFFIFSSCIVCAQENDEHESGESGKSTKVGETTNGGRLFGMEYELPEYITNFDIDTERRDIILEIGEPIYRDGKIKGKNKYQLCLFDLQSNSFLWVTEIKSSGQSKISHVGDKLIRFTPNDKSACYDKNTGNIIWTLKDEFSFLNKKHSIGITADGTCIDINTGKVKWKHNLQELKKWLDVKYFDDNSIILFTSAGNIHKINLENGQGWVYENGEVEKSPINCIVYDNKIYYTYRSNIICLNDNGQLLWQVPIDANHFYKSYISIIRDYLFVLLYRGDEQIYILPNNRIMMISCNLRTGEEKYRLRLKTEQQLGSFIFVGSAILMHCGDIIHKYNIETGEKLFEKTTKKTALEQYTRFINPYAAVTNTYGAYFQDLVELYPNDYFLVSNTGDMLHTDYLFNPTGKIANSNWWEIYLKEENSYLVSRGYSYMAIIRKGQKAASLKINNARMAGTTLIDFYSKKFRIIPLHKILN